MNNIRKLSTWTIFALLLTPAAYADSTPNGSAPQRFAVADPLATTPDGQALHAAWVKAGYHFAPDVRAAFLALAKAQARAELAAAGQMVPADFLAWVDNDPVVEATVYGIKDKPANVLRILRSLDLDLGSEVVRKQYTQLALAMAVSNADAKDFKALGINLSERPAMKLVIPPNPLTPVNTNVSNRSLDVNDHIINFLNSEPLEYVVKIAPAKKGDPITTEKRTRPMVGADVLASKELQAKFNAYMKAHGQTVEVNCLPPNPSLYAQMGPTVRASEMFRTAYMAKGLLPNRDPIPTLAETCSFLIRNNEYKFPSEANRVWPLFPLKAPWPTLTFLAQSRAPLRECEDIWQTFVETGRAVKKGPAYVGSIAQKPDLLRARSVAPLDFGYGSVQMMCKDGGVCGVQSGVWAGTQLALGRPAATTAEVGHCGTTGWAFNAKDNTYSCGNNTQAPWYWVFSNPVKGGGDRYHRSTAFGINHGLQSYLDSFMASRLYSLISVGARQAHGLELIKSGLEINPYNILLFDTAGDLDPLTQLRLIDWLTARQTAVNKPSCPVYVVRSLEVFANTVLTKPVPHDEEACREVYAYLAKDKKSAPIALARYLTAAEGLPATLGKAEMALKDHLASARTAASCTTTAQLLQAAAKQIPDKAQQRAWGKARLSDFSGHELYFGGGNKIVTDACVPMLAALAGETAPPQPAMMPPFLAAMTTRLEADINGPYDPRAYQKLFGEMRAVLPQITDLDQKTRWREMLISLIGDRAAYQDLKQAWSNPNGK